MPVIKNNTTGFIANASDADWNSGVYGDNWSINEGASAPVEASPPPVLPGSSDSRTWSINTDSAIPVDEMGGDEAPIELPEEPVDNTQADATATQANDYAQMIQDMLDEANQNAGDLQEQEDVIEGSIEDLIGQLGEKGADQLQAEQNAGIPGMQQDLAELNATILERYAEYENLVQNVEGQGTGMTVRKVLGQQGAIRKQEASELGLLQARALGMQGNIKAAQNTVNRAIDLKYSTIESRLQLYQFQLESIRDDLTKEEQTQWDLQQRMLEEARMGVEQDKADDKEKENMALQIMQNGGDSALANMISNADNLVEALEIAGELANGSGWQYVATPVERDALIAKGYEITQAGGRTYARLPSADMSDYTSTMKEYTLAKQQGYEGSYQDWVNFIKAPRTSAPTSYREWNLAGGLEGTGMTYNEWMQNNGSGDADDIQAFEEKAADLIIKIDSGDMEFKSAFDSLKAEFPQASNDAINSILGGGIPYNPETGEWTTKDAWGRAK